MAQETQQKNGGFQQEFNALPLDQKFSQLFQMEMATLNEAAKYVADSSMKLFEKFGDALSDLGTKVEAEAKKATSANCDPIPQPEKKTKAKPATKSKPSAAKPE